MVDIIVYGCVAFMIIMAIGMIFGGSFSDKKFHMNDKSKLMYQLGDIVKIKNSDIKGVIVNYYEPNSLRNPALDGLYTYKVKIENNKYIDNSINLTTSTSNGLLFPDSRVYQNKNNSPFVHIECYEFEIDGKI